jgi:hypothetical protein
MYFENVTATRYCGVNHGTEEEHRNAMKIGQNKVIAVHREGDFDTNATRGSDFTLQQLILIQPFNNHDDVLITCE